jgi:hypothetical protein
VGSAERQFQGSNSAIRVDQVVGDGGEDIAEVGLGIEAGESDARRCRGTGLFHIKSQSVGTLYVS